MAYEWDFKKQSGTFTFNGYTYNFYVGNGFMIILDEYKHNETGEDMYNVSWFFIDKAHAKRCLGLVKGSYDMFEGIVEKIVIYKENCPNWKDIIDLFTRSQKDIVIEIRNEKEVA